MGDRLISLSAAIDAVHKNYDTILDFRSDGETVANSVEDILSELPSAIDTNVATTDTISRAAVVDAIEGVDWYHQNDSGEMVHGANSAEHQAWYKAEDIYAAIDGVPPARPVEDARAMCGECDAWNKYKNYPQPDQFNPCTVCQEFDCTGCKFRRT